MSRITRIGSLAACALVAAAVLAAEAAAQAQVPTAAQVQQGRAVFEAKGNCWTCHGKEGRGTPLGPNLTDGEWLNIDGSLDSIRVVIRGGIAKPKKHPAPMPALGGAKLSAAEIEAVAAYVLTLSRPKQPTSQGAH